MSQPDPKTAAKASRITFTVIAAILIGGIGILLRFQTGEFRTETAFAIADVARFMMALAVGLMVVAIHQWIGAAPAATASERTAPVTNPDFSEPAHMPLNIDSKQPFPFDGIEESPRKGGVIDLKANAKHNNDSRK